MPNITDIKPVEHSYSEPTSHEPLKATENKPVKIKKLTPKQIAALNLVILFGLLFLGFGVYAYQLNHNSSTSSKVASSTATPVASKPVATPTPTPSLAASALNGTLVASGSENLHPLAVMIENLYPDARPQKGLGSADVVYEALTEGGITRFMAVFSNPTALQTTGYTVGPVRSARPYYVDFATELGAFYAHAGGSDLALKQIANTGVYDLNGLVIGNPTFYRDTKNLWQYATSTKGWSSTGNFSPWLFQDDAPLSARPASQKVAINFSSAEYNVVWNYDTATNTYLRTMGGTPHLDANTGNQITAKNIIIEQTTYQSLIEPGNKQVYTFTLTGSGPAVVIQNGKAITATWKKSGTDRTRYFDSAGNEISLLRGQTWVELTHADMTTSF